MSLVQGCEALVYTKLQLSLVTGQKELPGGPYNPTPPFIINDITNGPTNVLCAARAAQMSTPLPPHSHLSSRGAAWYMAVGQSRERHLEVNLSIRAAGLSLSCVHTR